MTTFCLVLAATTTFATLIAHDRQEDATHATKPPEVRETPAAHQARKLEELQTLAKRKRLKLDARQVTRHNADLLSTLEDDLPARDFSWEHIVIHHTASEWSSLARIDRYHREKFDDPDGIEYHFLIGNGKKQPEGLIEPARWLLQKRAIHLFKPEGAPDAIAISLVGNLHERDIRDAQYDALLTLVHALRQRHDIPLEQITTHTRVDGNLTVCPGKHFPFETLIKDLRRLDEEAAKPAK